ncbi:antitoxin [Arthrobacter crusticola]|uniref:Antitoxin n=1 Tax=Arthrobacter crusticola TaxID=2547960 RepID=A0A4V3AMR3_9MICC|nr:antitoxin [Arthrobacter crusticola]TDK27834.1 antitoxin [Arthrobacter crusticola]
MSVFDGLKGKAGGLKDKATGLIGANSGKVKTGITKAGGFVDGRTGGKYSGRIRGVQSKASAMVDKIEREQRGGTTGPTPPPASSL